jgi:nucleoside-diphosphate-sugar epimerase
MSAATLPARFDGIEDLEEFMTRPSPALVDELAALDGDLLVIGVGGKMGPTLARLAKRAAPAKRVIGVARFSEPGLAERLNGFGVETIAGDLLEQEFVQRLPRAANVVFMAGRKFGSSGAEHLTWAMNALVPAMVAATFCESRIVAFSTGCVYPFVPIDSGGAREHVVPNPPPGEYANSCVARERLFEYGSARYGTRGRLIRLNYAIDMRYGVLHDIATKVMDGAPIDLASGHVNVIWQGDANSYALRALARCTAPPAPLNVSGDIVAVRALAAAFGARLGRQPVLRGSEAPTGWVVDPSECRRLMSSPLVSLERMIDWVADWVAAGGASLGKPTHYEVRDGVF